MQLAINRLRSLATLVTAILLLAPAEAAPRQLHSRSRRLAASNTPDVEAGACLNSTFTNAERDKRVFSQVGEDGIIESIFQCIGTTNKYFVEFGVESGVQCTTRLLRERHGWTGLMMDGSNQNESINLRRKLIYAHNIVQLFQKYDVPQSFDQLTVDIDLNTFWVLREVLAAGYKPRSLTVEINRNLGPSASYTAVNLPKEMWVMHQEGAGGTCYFGASLMAYERLTAAFGYQLVAVDTDGVNAFFIHKDATGGQQVFTHDQVVSNTRDKGTWHALHGYCHNGLWLEVGPDVDFQSKQWQRQLRPVMLRHVRATSDARKRVFLEQEFDTGAIGWQPHAAQGSSGHILYQPERWFGSYMLVTASLCFCLVGCGVMAVVMRLRKTAFSVKG